MFEIDPITDLPADSGNGPLRLRRRVFYEKVLSITPKRTAQDLQRLCHAWRVLLEAKWVWLWLFHPGNKGAEGHWELTSVDADGPIEQYVPENLTPADGNHTVVEFASLLENPKSKTSGRPVLVRKIAQWRQTLHGKEYRVVCAPFFESKGCLSVMVIPLIPPKDGSDKDAHPTSKFRQPLRAAICAHFEAAPPEALEGESSLTLMGRLSAHFISSSYEAAEHKILTRMNSLAEEFLTRKTKTRRPEEDRREYLTSVIKLIKEHLSVEYASVFYRNHANDAIVCIATTGIHDRTGKLIGNAELPTVAYSKHESLTGTVFATGEPYFSRIGEKPARPQGKYREQPDDTSEQDLAWVAYPIHAPSRPGATGAFAEVLGVIRCIGNLAEFAPDRRRNIDPLQVQTLDFIARMMAPVLETMATNIERERVIGIIKHDLFAPLKMMQDTISLASSQMEKGLPLNEYFLPDLEFCILTATNLVAGLDQNPTQLREYEPIPTRMEGDIVASIRNMLSHYARFENDMEIRFQDIRSVFPRLLLDRNLISRALCNLIVNAIKYGEPSTTIHVDSRDDAQGYYLEVSNQGMGVAEEEKGRIFEEGYRSPRAKTKKIGLGMGLPIAKAIMTRHGGGLTVRSEKGMTVFTMFFPARLKC